MLSPDSPAAAPAPLAPAPLHPAPEIPPQPLRPDDRQGLAILLVCITSLIFAIQDGLARHLGTAYSPIFVTMVRYWFFAVFVLAMAARGPGGLRSAARSHYPVLQITRGLLLVFEIVIMVAAFVKLGLIETHAVFTAYPLLVVALSGPVLGERIGWRRWAAVGAGFVGILIILQPGLRVFSPWAILPLIAALMFAVYGLLTRLVSAKDSAEVSFFWTGIAGVAGITLVGAWHMEPIARADWPWMAGLCICGVISHYLLIRAYSLAEASSLQPFSYTQLVWVSLIGVLLLGEEVRPNVILGMLIIVGAGLFTWWRTLQKARAEAGPR
ncbi:DMT family transporter [Paracoccus sp. (in: a-proteobacteria)]|uniref:DMT family transporter n=1 Tax=Paracoccus sp. TaxID=267 RepID=UPI0026DEA995|nr:DMT family transporter [Paracoccus sp. (in: a-proteobacteria)]MDO5369026.1 DMT family transporter [Paracoccus sp. (in: a-proteobacteria)]